MLREMKSTVEKKMRELKENYWISETEIIFLKKAKSLGKPTEEVQCSLNGSL